MTETNESFPRKIIPSCRSNLQLSLKTVKSMNLKLSFYFCLGLEVCEVVLDVVGYRLRRSLNSHHHRSNMTTVDTGTTGAYDAGQARARARQKAVTAKF